MTFSVRPAARARRRSLLATAVIGLALALAAPAAWSADLSEDFDPVVSPGSAYVPAGWNGINRSAPLGTTSWFQGSNVGAGGPFNAHQGDPSSYIGANFNSTGGGNGVISNWLITPQITTLTNGDTMSFYTRAADAEYPDRLEVRLSTNGTCAPGADSSGVGSFTTLLVSVNPTQAVHGYPGTWTQYTTTLDGLPPNASGCVAFRYFVTSAGPLGNLSDYIGIDTFRFVEDVIAPDAPSLTAVTPASPSNDNTPRATGAAEAGSTVRIYGDSACTGTVLGTGSATAFNGGAGVAFTVPSDATTTPYATATDGSGNVSACSAAGPAYLEDSTAPVTTDDVPAGWQTATPAITLTATDAHGVAATYYEIGADPAVPTTASPVYDPADKPTLSDGQKIRYRSVDVAGNAETPHTSAAVQVDLDAPTTTDDVPSDWVDAAPAVTLDAADAGSGVTATYYELGAAPALPTTASEVYDPATKPTLADGQKIRYFSIDATGHAETPHTSEAAQVDLDAPATTDDVTASTAPGAPVTLTASDASSGVAATYYTTGADPAVPTAASSTYDPASRPVLAAGERIRYLSVDRVGNAEEARTSVAVPIPPKPEPDPDVPPKPQPDPSVPPTPQPIPEGPPAPPTGPAPQLIKQLTSNGRCLGTGRNASNEITARYTTAQAAKVTFTLQRRTAPKLAAPSSCPRERPAGNGTTTKEGTPVVYTTATAKTAARAVGGGARQLTLTRSEKAGKHTLALLRTFKVRSLTPGRYRLLVQPATAGGTPGRATSLYLWVLAARR